MQSTIIFRFLTDSRFAADIAGIRVPLLALAGLTILPGVVTDQTWSSSSGFSVLIIGQGALLCRSSGVGCR